MGRVGSEGSEGVASVGSEGVGSVGSVGIEIASHAGGEGGLFWTTGFAMPFTKTLVVEPW